MVWLSLNLFETQGLNPCFSPLATTLSFPLGFCCLFLFYRIIVKPLQGLFPIALSPFIAQPRGQLLPQWGTAVTAEGAALRHRQNRRLQEI